MPKPGSATMELAPAATAGEVVAILFSAWVDSNSLVLAPRRVDEKSNEITATPKLLDGLELSGSVVTIDNGLAGKYRRQDSRQKGRLHFGGEKKSGTAARRSSGFLSHARLRCGRRRHRLRTWASRAAVLLSHRRPVIELRVIVKSATGTTLLKLPSR